MERTKLRFAIIGCGRIAYKHVEALICNDAQAELVAVSDEIPERAAQQAQRYAADQRRCPAVYADYRELLQQEAVEAVAIATESGKHAALALTCMAAGKHVLVEKPMALSTADADAMIACGQRRGVKLAVAHQNRFNPTIQRLRQALEQGRFGRVIAGNARILWNRNQEYYIQAPWRGTLAQDGGCLMNQCIHNIDLLQWMLGGEIEAVQAMLGNYVHPYMETEDYGSIQAVFAGGAIGNVEGTVCVYPRNLEETLTILGERGTVVIGGTALNQVQVWQFADGRDTLAEVQCECNNEIDSVYGRGHTPLYADFIDSILTGREPLISGQEGKKGMSLILHAYLADRNRERVWFGRQEIDITRISPLNTKQ